MKTEYLNNKQFESIIRRFQQSKQEKVRFALIIEDIKSSVEKRSKYKKDSFHSLEEYEIKYNAANSEFINSQKELATAFYTLSEHLTRYAKDIIADTDDAIQEGVMICFEKIDRFNPDKGAAFNYMTTCVLNHYRQIYRVNKSFRLFKERYLDFMLCKHNKSLNRNSYKNSSDSGNSLE